MTPLAQRVVRETEIRKSQRSFDDQADVARLMDDIHCFDFGAVYDLVYDDLGRRWKPQAAETLAFLPASRTWLETDIEGGRLAFHLMKAEEHYCEMRIVFDCDGVFASVRHVYFIGLKASGRLGHYSPRDAAAGAWDKSFDPMSPELSPGKMVTMVHCVLALINSPRIIGRTAHMPHAGFQRELAHARGMVGKFPLRAWTEIKLEVRPPRIEQGGEEIRLSGARALHFVRTYLRVYNGKLVEVAEHWRGNAALGIVQSRYRLVLPDSGKPHRDAR
jgi:hypothetical protein